MVLLIVQTFQVVMINSSRENIDISNPFPIHIRVLDSGGFQAFLSPTTFSMVGLQFFSFHSNVNAPIRLLEIGRFHGVITKVDFNGYWIFNEETAQVNKGDVINYWAYIEVNGVGYKIDCRSFIVYDFDKGDV